jgi:hypothetical protein
MIGRVELSHLSFTGFIDRGSSLHDWQRLTRFAIGVNWLDESGHHKHLPEPRIGRVRAS